VSSSSLDESRIIVRGRNHYPHDIEDTACAAHSSVRAAGAAAFSIAGNSGERVVVAVEVERRDLAAGRADRIAEAVGRAVASQHGLEVHDVLLLKPGGLPRTSSGKVRRAACREAYLENPATALGRLSSKAPADPEQDTGETLAAWLRDYAATRINSQTIDQRRTIPPSIALDFGNRGLLGMRAGRDYGGLALSHTGCAAVIEQLGAIDLTLSLFVGLNNYLGIAPIARHGGPQMRARLLPPLAAGRELAAFALTEPGAGSNPRALVTAAEPDGPGCWRLYGVKVWSGAAQWAGVIIVFARHAPADPVCPGAISAFVVKQGAAGLRQGPEALTMGMRGLIQNSVYLDGVRVTEADLLGVAGDGMAVAHDAMMEARFAIAAACTGAMKRAIQIGHRFASRRAIASGRLLDHPVTRERLGDAVSATAALSALVSRVGAALDAGIPVPADVLAACKCLAPEMLWVVADHLMQLLGGRGYIETNVAPQLMRDARVLRVFEGPTETLHAFLGARAQVSPGALADTLRAMFAAPHAADAYAGAVADVLNGAHTEPLLLHARLGRVAAAAILLAATEGSAQEGWARARFVAARREAAVPSAPPDAGALSAGVQQLTATIGGSDQRLPGEDRERDALLRDDEMQAVPAPGRARPDATEETAGGPSADQIRGFLTARVAARVRTAMVDSGRPFAELGLDSLALVELVQEVSDWLGRRLDETLLWEYPTIDALAEHLGSEGPTSAPDTTMGPGDGASLDDELLRLEQLLREPE
jgi:alkylation response protein AidB-like acyl-CoA dehydrogenase